MEERLQNMMCAVWSVQDESHQTVSCDLGEILVVPMVLTFIFVLLFIFFCDKTQLNLFKVLRQQLWKKNEVKAHLSISYSCSKEFSDLPYNAMKRSTHALSYQALWPSGDNISIMWHACEDLRLFWWQWWYPYNSDGETNCRAGACKCRSVNKE